MNGNHHAVAPGGSAGLFAAPRTVARWLVLTALMACAGQVQAQAIRDDGWARMSPNAGYGFEFYMESVLKANPDSVGHSKYDLLYTDGSQGRQGAASRFKGVAGPTAGPQGDPKVHTLADRDGSEGLAALAPGLNGAVPVMVFTASLSNRCVARYAICDRNRFTYEPVSNLQTP
ncbi:hypothetical protein ACFSHT_18615 [Paraburkholderia silviterrae]|uniref:Uncharacterized protein n=1 Tax=Paraburkholderia silviterrae TaxID=2528715 RepID=A0A4R5MA34_9BURK|nr:hypothetical protein [Paraburkholderia silviterrae]TDG22867.1 hypothetical protein EYW47_16810 [Paraburkholderia silviterrae]